MVDYDDLLYGPDSDEPPSRIRYERNGALLHWLQDWIGVNNPKERRKAIRAYPNMAVPARYRRLPAKAKLIYRGLKFEQAAMDRLLDRGKVTLRRNGIVSYSLDYARAAEFAVLDPSVVVEKTLQRAAVFLYVPACLDDMAWIDAKTADDWKHNRRELNFFARESEVLLHDDDAEWRTIRLTECVSLHDGYNPHPVNMKRKIAWKLAHGSS